MSNKPWLNAPIDDRWWVRPGNHKSIMQLQGVDAVVAIQDCNMGGDYHRLIYYHNNEPYFDSADKTNWPFSVDWSEWKLGIIMKSTHAAKELIVVSKTEYVAVLESQQ